MVLMRIVPRWILGGVVGAAAIALSGCSPGEAQSSNAQAANARAQAARYQDLLQRGIATREQVDTMRTQATALEATVAADRANIETATVQLTYATIKSPMSGRTGLLQVHPGNLIRAQDT